MLPDLPSPSPTPIDRVSPSLANDLLACELRVGFARDARFSAWRRPSTFSVLGVAAHRMIETALRSRALKTDDVSDEFERVWDEVIAEGRQLLLAAWQPVTPPPPADWPGYQLTRTRALRRARRIVATHRSDRVVPADAISVERWMEPEGSILVGRADRVDRCAQGLRVVDVKTGLQQAAPTDEQRRQLLLYAVLVYRTHGEWPAEIALEGANGVQQVFELDAEEALAAEQEVLEAVDRFNHQVEIDELESSARPGADRCRHCPYRVVCHPYWQALSPRWEHASVLGSIVAAGESHVELRIASPRERASAVARISDLATSIGSLGTWLAAVDLRRAPGQSGDFVARWSSVLNEW